VKEIIKLAEQFHSIAKLGLYQKELSSVNVQYDDFLKGDLETITMGGFHRTFSDSPSIYVKDRLLFDEEAQNVFIEEYTLKLNKINALINVNSNHLISA